MSHQVRVGTRSSQLAVWQATHVQQGLATHGAEAELTYIKSEGDIDLKTPLYEMGVQGIFTRTLDIALLDGRIDIAVHSMKDVPTRLPKGIVQAAVLPRATYTDILVQRQFVPLDELATMPATIATSSTRRRAQWLHRYPHHNIDNLRGNVNSRLQKVADSNWDGAIFAAAGLERIDLRPPTAIDLDWMLPAPAQGAIVVVCREGDEYMMEICSKLNDPAAAICTQIEKDFLRTLRGGCTAPIGALATVIDNKVHFQGNLLTPDGKDIIEIQRTEILEQAANIGNKCGEEMLENGGLRIIEELSKTGTSGT